MHNKSRLFSLIQYALLRAGEEDLYTSRSLGPIHIIKYVYLADLYYAEKHGVTFTGIEWQFYNFGPWSNNVHSSISPALSEIMANKKCLENLFKDDDSIRWDKTDNYLLRDKAREIPAEITARLSRDIHNFSNDTKALLDYVYKTEPMLSASPCEIIEFKQVQRIMDNPLPTRVSGLSNKKKKSLKQKIDALKTKHLNSCRERKLIKPVEFPRYDEVYECGIKWLDDLDKTEKLEETIVVEFSEDVWQSQTRKSYELP
ncbi:SocA family protein [Vibrio fluvialis]|uniref:SocA family protein n=1 Tax=Vibrio fluvialis TaxID=676 RepID=UPI001EECC9CF|nr:SocA family protein [Vibrio fluvialis]MCG6372827.1 SocA family protein [Vibrio fluvialis]